MTIAGTTLGLFSTMLGVIEIIMTFNFILLAAGGYFFWRLIVRPFALTRFYKRQGATVNFIPLVGDVDPLSIANNISIWTKGDLFYRPKQRLKRNPNMRAYASNYMGDVIINLIDPDLVREFLTKQEYYKKSQKYLGLFNEVMHYGVLFVDGEPWKKLRKLLQSTMNLNYLNRITPYWLDISQDLFKGFLKANKDTPENLNNFDILQLCHRIPGELWGSITFGDLMKYKMDNGNDIIEEAAWINYQASQQAFNPLIPLVGQKTTQFSFWPKHREIHTRIRNFRKKIYDMVMQKKQEYFKMGGTIEDMSQNKNLLFMWFETQKDKQEYLSDWEIVDNFMNIFAAGFNNTGQSMQMMTYFLGLYPDIRKQILAEAEKCIFNKDTPTLGDFNAMKYTEAFIKESLRIAPSAAALFPREALEDHYLGDFMIKKGTLVLHEMIVNNFNPKWHDDPEKFNVDRWLDLNSKSLENEANVFLPFSGGPRTCLGFQTGFVLIELKIFLSQLVRNFDFKIAEGYRPKMTWGFMYEPTEHVRLSMTPRISDM